ncbi:MAG: septation protein A [Betaproteobacteria bacterium]|nr:MAG: septation protein A [Betaproteobacteria bacterium]
MQFILEYAPIILFFAAYKLKDIYFATGVAIVASILAIAYAWFVTKKVTTMQWLSLGIIVVFGGATLLLHDETFIKWKPSALYGALGLTLLFGKLVMKRDWVGILFKQANIQAPAAVWTRITWAWIVFFAFMAALNGYIATYFSLDAWVNFKVWWAMGIFFAFTIGNVLLLARYISDAPAASEPSANSEPRT